MIRICGQNNKSMTESENKPKNKERLTKKLKRVTCHLFSETIHVATWIWIYGLTADIVIYAEFCVNLLRGFRTCNLKPTAFLFMI